MSHRGRTHGADDHDDRIERHPERLPLFRDGGGHGRISLHAVRIKDEEAYFEDTTLAELNADAESTEAVPDDATAETGLDAGHTVWVGVTHHPDGTRAYTGLGVGTRDAAIQGQIALGTLHAQDRKALRQALLTQDPEAWDQAPDEVHDALKNKTILDTQSSDPDP